MAENLTTVLLVALTGMALVLVTILFFWAFLSGLVWLLGGRREGGVEAGAEVEAAAAEPVAVADSAEEVLRRQAALVAVAVALAQETGGQPRPFPLPPMPLVSTWQSVNRARQLGQRRVVR